MRGCATPGRPPWARGRRRLCVGDLAGWESGVVLHTRRCDLVTFHTLSDSRFNNVNVWMDTEDTRHVEREWMRMMERRIKKRRQYVNDAQERLDSALSKLRVPGQHSMYILRTTELVVRPESYGTDLGDSGDDDYYEGRPLLVLKCILEDPDEGMDPDIQVYRRILKRKRQEGVESEGGNDDEKGASEPPALAPVSAPPSAAAALPEGKTA